MDASTVANVAGRTLLVSALTLVMSLIAIGAGKAETSSSSERASSETTHNMKINIKISGRTLTATLAGNPTARDFVSLLPLTLTMNDLFGREKFAHLPRAISTKGKRTHTYEVGDIAYWSPGPDIAIYYQHDDEKIPNPGIIVIGKLDSDVDAFNVAGSVEVKIELVHQ